MGEEEETVGLEAPLIDEANGRSRAGLLGRWARGRRGCRVGAAQNAPGRALLQGACGLVGRPASRRELGQLAARGWR
jgi:hypothetical protein